jgi:RimJ/RimL family protein N-acetyltransferase
MSTEPILRTERLVLRPFTLNDASEVQRLAGDREIARETTEIPHPYEDGVAERWISTHAERFVNGEGVTLAVTLRSDGRLLGAISLEINRDGTWAEMGYWIGKPYWGQGYCTEAAREMLRYAFEAIGLHRVQARHFPRNPASGRVMQKIGMTCEGRQRQHVKKWGEYLDLEIYGILEGEWRPRV